MKRLITALSLSAVFLACNSKTNNQAVVVDSSGKVVALENAPVMKFEEELYDFGVIEEGQSVKYEFKFTNSGKSPLIISNATATCGCTVPDYPTKPVKPGESGLIKIVFNSQGKEGMQDKVVSIISNANPNLNTLHVVGEVKKKK